MGIDEGIGEEGEGLRECENEAKGWNKLQILQVFIAFIHGAIKG